MKKINLFVILAIAISSIFMFQSCSKEDSNLTSEKSSQVAKLRNTEPVGPHSEFANCQSCDEIKVTYEVIPNSDGCEYKVTVTNGNFGEFCRHRFLIGSKPFPLETSPATIYVKPGQILTIEVFNESSDGWEKCYKQLFPECSNCETIDCSLINIDYKLLDVKSLNGCCVYKVTVTNDNYHPVVIYNLQRAFSSIVLEGNSNHEFNVEVCKDSEWGYVSVAVGCFDQQTIKDCASVELKCRE